MMTLNSLAPPAAPMAYDHAPPTAPTTGAANAALAARAARNAQATEASETADSAQQARTAAAATAKSADAARIVVPDVMDSLSTVAIAGAMNSLPAAQSFMRDIAVAAASGGLSNADRQTLQAEYAQLSRQVSAVVGSSSASAQTSSSNDKETDEKEAAENASRQSGDDRRSTLTQTDVAPAQTLAGTPAEKLVTTTSAGTEVPTGIALRQTPGVVLHTHELHVGTDSYEPVAVRQTQTRLTRPATIGEVEHHATTHRVYVAQIAQITQLTQVAHVSQLSAIA